MFSSNLTLKATLLAEKVKEKEDNKMAARYIKIRALLDEAEKVINAANITRSLKNKLMSKHVKARRALDSGLNVEEVVQIMTLIISMVNQEIRQDKNAIDTTTSEMRKNLDTFYKYDFDKFLERERLEQAYQHDSKDQNQRARSQTRGSNRPSSSVVWKRSPSVGNVGRRAQPPLNDDKYSKLVTVEQYDRADQRIPGKKNEENRNVEKLEVSDNEEIETFKRDITSAGIESLEADEEETADERDPAAKHSLETLNLALSILQDVPHLILSKTQHDNLVSTMKSTKRLLMTPVGCKALAGPLTLLKSSIDVGREGLPREPLFTQSLVEIRLMVSSYEGVEKL